MTDKEKIGYQGATKSLDLIRDMHSNKPAALTRQVARALLGDAPRELDDIKDEAEHARATSRAMMKETPSGVRVAEAVSKGESIGQSWDAFIEDVEDLLSKNDAPREIRKTAFADTWRPGMSRAEERELVARRLRARGQL